MPSCKLVIVTISEARFSSLSISVASVSTTATAPPPSVQIVEKSLPPVLDESSVSRFTTGAFTFPTVIVTTSVSLKAPPVPVLPKSSVVTVTVAVPLKDVVGVKVDPSKAVLISAIVPVNVIVVSSVPSPTVKVTGLFAYR